MISVLYEIRKSRSGIRTNVFDFQRFRSPVGQSLESDPLAGQVNVKWNQVPEWMDVGKESLNFGNAGMLGQEGDFQNSGGLVKVSGLWSCVGLIIAARRTTGREFGPFAACHFGGNEAAWKEGFEKLGPETLHRRIARWDVQSGLYAVAAAGHNHPRTNLTLGRELSSFCEGLDVDTLVLFWTARGIAPKDRKNEERKRDVAVSLGLRADGEVCVYRNTVK